MTEINIKARLLVRSSCLKKLITLMPFIMLFITFVLTFARLISGYSELYSYLSQIMGYSIFTNIYMLSNAIKNKYCSYSLISISSLLFLNISNIGAMALNLHGNNFYIGCDAVLILGLFTLALTKYLKEARGISLWKK